MIIDVIEYRRISLRFRRTVSETVPRMKDAEVIDVLESGSSTAIRDLSTVCKQIQANISAT